MSSLSDFSDQLADIIAQVTPTIVGIQARRSVVSGIHCRPGIVVTTVDAVRCREEVILVTAVGQKIEASVVGEDAGTDIAVLQVEAPLPTAQLGDLSALRIGHLVLALGRSEGGHIRASMGILSALGGAWQSWTGGHIDQLMRPDITLFAGFVGSPLLDTQGRFESCDRSSPQTA